MLLENASRAFKQALSKPFRSIFWRSLGLTLLLLVGVWIGLQAVLASFLVVPYPWLETALSIIAGFGSFIFMNLTSWKGGYRASTRGCNSPALKNISAWDLNGKQVTLKDGNGAAIGSVFPTNSGRFSGQTAGGRQLAFFR